MDDLSSVLSAGRPGDSALVIADDGEQITYSALAARVETLARRLAGLGVERGSRVAVALPNGPEIVELLLAITFVGAAAAPLNPAYTRDEFAFYLDDIGPRLLLVPAGRIQPARDAAGATPVVDVVAGEGAPPDLIAGGQPVGEAATFTVADADDIALVLHTSGTTSRPKQVPLLHRNIVASVRTIAGHYALGADDVSF